jgi:hypothetical protein
MRTTLTLDDDLAEVLERESEARGVSFKVMVNTTLRRGLVAGSMNASAHPRVVSRPFGGGLLPGMDPDRMNQLNDELEIEGFRKKQSPERP